MGRGDVELGIQQHSELKHMHDIDVAGLIKNEIQLKSPFSGAIVTTWSRVDEARKLLGFLIKAFLIKIMFLKLIFFLEKICHFKPLRQKK